MLVTRILPVRQIGLRHEPTFCPSRYVVNPPSSIAGIKPGKPKGGGPAGGPDITKISSGLKEQIHSEEWESFVRRELGRFLATLVYLCELYPLKGTVYIEL